jgi:hypothetical protein
MKKCCMRRICLEEWHGEERAHKLLATMMGHKENKKGVIYFTSKN